MTTLLKFVLYIDIESTEQKKVLNRKYKLLIKIIMSQY